VKEFNVDSVSKYLEVFEKIGYGNHIFRGQNEPYNGISAGGFRPYRGGFNTDTFYDLEKIKSIYYEKVIKRLSLDERNHFLAFCQHHGLPTNLIDFSYSPLVALFFSSYGKSVPKLDISDNYDYIYNLDSRNLDSIKNNVINKMSSFNNDGYYSKFSEVYLIEKKRLIDITDIILEENIDGLFTEMSLNDNLRLKIRDKLIDNFNQEVGLFSEWISNIISEIVAVNKELLEYEVEKQNIQSLGQKLLDKPSEWEYTLHLIHYLLEYLSEDDDLIYGKMVNTNGFPETDYIKLAANIYIALLVILIDEVNREKNLYKFNLDIYFTYCPPNIFERIQGQKGLFIFQPYIYHEEEAYRFNLLNVQNINPDYKINIENWEKVVNDLNHMGINKESLFFDFDSISKSIVDSEITSLHKGK